MGSKDDMVPNAAASGGASDGVSNMLGAQVEFSKSRNTLLLSKPDADEPGFGRGGGRRLSAPNAADLANGGGGIPHSKSGPLLNLANGPTSPSSSTSNMTTLDRNLFARAPQPRILLNSLTKKGLPTTSRPGSRAGSNRSLNEERKPGELPRKQSPVQRKTPRTMRRHLADERFLPKLEAKEVIEKGSGSSTAAAPKRSSGEASTSGGNDASFDPNGFQGTPLNVVQRMLRSSSLSDLEKIRDEPVLVSILFHS